MFACAVLCGLLLKKTGGIRSEERSHVKKCKVRGSAIERRRGVMRVALVRDKGHSQSFMGGGEIKLRMEMFGYSCRTEGRAVKWRDKDKAVTRKAWTFFGWKVSRLEDGERCPDERVSQSWRTTRVADTGRPGMFSLLAITYCSSFSCFYYIFPSNFVFFLIYFPF